MVAKRVHLPFSRYRLRCAFERRCPANQFANRRVVRKHSSVIRRRSTETRVACRFDKLTAGERG
jgi:hypothetical protein